MNRETEGVVVAVNRQWWLKVNTKAVRTNGMDGAIFPHIVKVQYTVDGQEYFVRKWYGAGWPTPGKGSRVTVSYREEKPNRAKVI